MANLGKSIRRQVLVMGAPIDVLDVGTALQIIRGWADHKESRAVYLCNVHSVVTARFDPTFARILRDADLALPDGAPIAFVQRLSGAFDQRRISGPDLMWSYFRQAAKRGESIYLYGASQSTLDALRDNLQVTFSGLKIVGCYSPPFRPLSELEDTAIIDEINASGASTVWVSLGCPKQECWIDAHRGKIKAVMLGVGAAFDFHAGTSRRAPLWMRNNGLEWLFRLIQEPRRLWRRYFSTNSLFLLYASLEILQYILRGLFRR